MKYRVIACIYILILMSGVVMCGGFADNPDMRFLFNRAFNMLECIKDGNIPWFYYNDFHGMGYGSSFFYGQLTLYPFLVFVPFGIRVFSYVYIFVTIVLAYKGSKFLADRFCHDNEIVAILFTFSEYSVLQFVTSGTYANTFGLALSFFFIGYCVDFFRDNINGIKAVTVFFLVFNTHMITALLSALISILVMILYFDKSRLFGYFKIFVLCLISCSYNVANILYHSDILTRLDSINSIAFLEHDNGFLVTYYQDIFPVGGVLRRILFGSNGYWLFDTLTFLCLIYGVFRSGLCRRALCVLACCSILSFISVYDVWEYLNTLWLNPIQFPSRFAPYIVIAFLIVSCRYRLKSWFVLLPLPMLVMCSVFVSDVSMQSGYFDSVCNGEYLDKSFVWDENYLSSVLDSGDFMFNKNVCIYYSDGSESKIQFPKLYYRGYEAYGDEKEFRVSMGYSQFVTVNVGDYVGNVCVRYTHPIWLRVLCVVCYMIVGCCSGVLCCRFVFRRYFCS